MKSLDLVPTAYSGSMDAVLMNASADEFDCFHKDAEANLELVHERNVARKQAREAAKAVKNWRHLTYGVLITTILALLLTILSL